MFNARINRISSSPNSGTFGVMTINGLPFCVTLERYKYGNEQNKSCIPTGQYTCKRVESHNFGNSFEVSNVANRTNILIHVGNTVDDSSGCILLGSSFGKLKDKHAILKSRDTINEFMYLLENETMFILTITENF